MNEFIEKLIKGISNKKDYFQRLYECEGKTEHDADLNKATQLAFDDCLSVIEQLAEEYNNDGWIPCSERLPSGSELWVGNDIEDAEPREFIVMVKGASESTTGYYTVDGWVKDIYDKEKRSGYADEIIAWRFFPAPYQPKGE